MTQWRMLTHAHTHTHTFTDPDSLVVPPLPAQSQLLDRLHAVASHLFVKGYTCMCSVFLVFTPLRAHFEASQFRRIHTLTHTLLHSWDCAAMENVELHPYTEPATATRYKKSAEQVRVRCFGCFFP